MNIRFYSLLLLFICAASSQPLECRFGTTHVPPVVRQDGFAELVGDILLQCSGGIPGQQRTSTFRVSLNTNLTSKPISGSLTEALLLVNEPNAPRLNGPPTPVIAGVTAIQGRLISPNTVEFVNVPYTIRSAPEYAVTFRITNLRADATRIFRVGPTTTSGYILGRITSDNIDLSPTVPLLGFTVPAATTVAQTAGRINGCSSQNTNLLSDSSGSGVVSVIAGLDFNYFFKRRSESQQNIPGFLYRTESGFFDPSLASAEIGLATQGARVLLTLRNVPPGVSVFVATAMLNDSYESIGVLISGGPSDGGPYTPLAPTGTTTIEGRTVGIRQIPVVGGTAQALWESTNPYPFSSIRPMNAGIVFAYQAPVQGSVEMTLGYAPHVPLSGISNAFPRFADNIHKQIIPIMPCNERDLRVLSMSPVPIQRIENAADPVTLTIQNQGAQTETSTLQMALYSDSNHSSKLADVAPCAIAPLAPGSSQTCNAMLPRLPAGSYYLRASVDPGNTIAEANETNNVASAIVRYEHCQSSITVNFGALQDLGCHQELTALTPNITLQPRPDGGYSFNFNAADTVGLIQLVETRGIHAFGNTQRPHSVGVTTYRYSGDEAYFQARFWRPDSNQIDLYYMLISSSLSPVNACYAEFNRNTRAFRLLDDAGQQWLGPMGGLSGGELSNSQCTLKATDPFFGSGPFVDVGFHSTFTHSFAGDKKVFLLQRNQADTINSGWQEHAVLSIPGARTPGVRELLPRKGSEVSTTFNATFKHDRGNTGHYLSYVLFLPVPNVVNYTATGSCLVEYNRIIQSIRLINDAGNDWLGPVIVRHGAPTLSNQRCTVDVSSVVANFQFGGDLSLAVPVTFKTAIGPMIATFLQGLDMKGTWTGMTQFGNWSLPGTPATRSGPYVVATGLARNGSTAIVNAVVAHTANRDALSMVHLRLSPTLVGSDPWCHMVYFPGSNTFNLVNDSGSAMVHPTGVAPGAPVVLSNGVCAVPLAQAAVARGQTLSINFPVMRTSQILPVETSAWVNAFDNAGLLSHWSATPNVLLP